MSVTFILRWKIHIIVISNTAHLFRVGRTFKSLALKNDILMRSKDLARQLLIEPRPV